MKRTHSWLALSAAAGLLMLQTPAARSAVTGTVACMGGGWILPTAVIVEDPDVPTATGSTPTVRLAGNNLKATFGFVASGDRQDDGSLADFHGELSYHDHGVGLRVHSLTVAGVEVVDALTMRFRGMAEVTTAAGTVPRDYVVTVHDAGEPGRADTLEIWLDYTLDGETTPYHRQGELGGGNIQTRP